MAARILTLRLGCCCYSPRSVPRVLPITLFYCPARSLNPTTALSNPTTSSSSSLRGTTETWLPALRSPVRCVSSEAAGERPRMPARLAQKQAALNAQPVYDDLDQPVPKISLEHVTMSFARSGGAGGQNVNKVNTKVDMRFKVMEADWLPERIRLKLLQMEKNRINSEGELVISSTKTRTQKGNIEDALSKLQELIDAAAYVPPPPSQEKLKRINRLARVENEKRLVDKKRAGSKKSERRNKGSWD
ncbi:hypothetical protein CY35_06G142700 [Sphagnum magellanicum]|nr:hypothetical protein CY35_06G142700 [Sphagnum magellanicum]KAH9561063.1 hypothetical protein CY35_06G142700 [Sphagnum magellanicum]KAH9561064.1 hypothetical protein CY35_06G142700 [Sphagnum magellanicum]KAH9561065.1 hypothetical protein CY35_06G142700 [Sphagnum magellanicum]